MNYLVAGRRTYHNRSGPESIGSLNITDTEIVGRKSYHMSSNNLLDRHTAIKSNNIRIFLLIKTLKPKENNLTIKTYG